MKKTLNLTRGLEVRGEYSNIDFLYGPYNSKSEACNKININVRKVGLTVGIIEQGSVVEYWWRDATDNKSLILKNSSKDKVDALEERINDLEDGFDQTFTLEEKQKLAEIEEGANNTDNDDVESWGFTKNKGTVTKVRINGQNIEPSTDGLVDLGRVELIQADAKLPNDYEISTLSNDDLKLYPGESYNSAFSKLEKSILDNEEVTTAALNDLETKKQNTLTAGNGISINEGVISSTNESYIIYFNGEVNAKEVSKAISDGKPIYLFKANIIYNLSQFIDNINGVTYLQFDDVYTDSEDGVETLYSYTWRDSEGWGTSNIALATITKVNNLEKTVGEISIVTAAALNDLNDRLNNIDISISSSYESPLSEGGITPNDSYEEAFRKLEDNIQNISKFIGEDIEIIPTLEDDIYYTGSNTILNSFSNYNTFTNSNKSIIKNVYLGNIYYYLLIPQSYNIKIITENNEDITEMFISKTNMTISNISYRVLEFHLSSNLPLDTNVTINITV